MRLLKSLSKQCAPTLIVYVHGCESMVTTQETHPIQPFHYVKLMGKSLGFHVLFIQRDKEHYTVPHFGNI